MSEFYLDENGVIRSAAESRVIPESAKMLTGAVPEAYRTLFDTVCIDDADWRGDSKYFDRFTESVRELAALMIIADDYCPAETMSNAQIQRAARDYLSIENSTPEGISARARECLDTAFASGANAVIGSADSDSVIAAEFIQDYSDCRLYISCIFGEWYYAAGAGRLIKVYGEEFTHTLDKYAREYAPRVRTAD